MVDISTVLGLHITVEAMRSAGFRSCETINRDETWLREPNYRKPLKPALRMSLCCVLGFVLFVFCPFQVTRMYPCGGQKGQALLRFLVCGWILCEPQMCLTLCGGLLESRSPFVCFYSS